MAKVDFRKFTEKIIKEVRLHGHLLLEIVEIVEQHLTFNGGISKEKTWVIMKRKPSVAMLVYDLKAKKVILVEQLRVPVGETLYEIPAGSMEAEENPYCVARIELREEVGINVGELEMIEAGYLSPGGTDELLYLFAVEVDIEKSGVKDGTLTGVVKESEDIRVHVIDLDRFFEMKIEDFKTSYARLWLKNKIGV